MDATDLLPGPLRRLPLQAQGMGVEPLLRALVRVPQTEKDSFPRPFLHRFCRNRPVLQSPAAPLLELLPPRLSGTARCHAVSVETQICLRRKVPQASRSLVRTDATSTS